MAPLPRGWPPLAPTEKWSRKLAEGKVLRDEELLQLERDAEHAERLEATDPDFMRACRAIARSVQRKTG